MRKAHSSQDERKIIMAKSKIEKGVTLVAANTEIAGDVKFEDQLYINGRINGNVLADPGSNATVVVSEEGSVHGEIRVPNVVINGSVEGNIYASARMELAAKAQVKGNVYYTLIEMQLGAMVDGQLVHDEKLAAESKNVHPFPADQKKPSEPGSNNG
jgi:cytoskeletal protein CcmA (bactofilin family)